MSNYKAHYKTTNGRLTFEMEASTTKEMFAQIGAVQEVFDEGACGKCGCTDLKFTLRVVGEAKDEYYELRCKNKDCRAKLAFGQHKKGGGIYPQRKDKNDNWMPDGGWFVYQKEGTTAPPPPRRQESSPASRATTKHMGAGPPPHAPVDEEVGF